MSETRKPSGLPVAPEALQQFRSRLRGHLIGPEDVQYNAARRIWNAMIDKRPALIARCAGVADVTASVNFARTHDIPISIRGGGHHIAGNALCDDGLVIDLSGMKSMRVDPANRTARAEPGLTWAEFDHETQAFGLATTGGVVGSTGIAGLTLGGGVGWLHSRHGLTVDNLLSADVVLADGRFVTASAGENEDLFWALRGGGGNFGVVTSFEYRLHPVTEVLAGPVFHPAERAVDVLRFYRDFTADLPDELAVYSGFLTDPAGNRLIGMVVCYTGPAEEGERLIRPLREFGPPVADLIGRIPYPALQSMFDDAFPPDRQNYWKSGFLADLSDDAFGIIAEFASAPASPTSLVMLENYHGAYSRVGKNETAYCHRDSSYNLLILSNWNDPAESDRNIEWARAFYHAMQPHFASQVFPNLMGQEEIGERIRDVYGANYPRLAEIKRKYDPENFFRLNINVEP